MRHADNPAQCQIFSAGTNCATIGIIGRKNQLIAAKMNPAQKMKPKKTFIVLSPCCCLPPHPSGSSLTLRLPMRLYVARWERLIRCVDAPCCASPRCVVVVDTYRHLRRKMGAVIRSQRNRAGIVRRSRLDRHLHHASFIPSATIVIHILMFLGTLLVSCTIHANR